MMRLYEKTISAGSALAREAAAELVFSLRGTN